jgi:hypothetical protein
MVWRGGAWTLGKWGPSWKPGESGDPAHQEGERADSWHRTVEEGRYYKMPQNIGDGLATTPCHVYAHSMYHCALCINYHINNHNRNCTLLYYLFQENKSFGSKKPFPFIPWCTRSCVKHTSAHFELHLCEVLGVITPGSELRSLRDYRKNGRLSFSPW